MAYFAPYIDASGLNIPTYQDIENALVASAQNIFGSDIYLGNDSQDFQDIAARAQALYDAMLSAQMAYNSRSPVTSVGAQLDGIVAINGIKRNGATSSSATVAITGTALTVITNGIVADTNGNLWNLPSSVTLDGSGNATVSVVCQASGPITALANTINIIITPTQGWSTVTNSLAATPGQSIETDTQLITRQAVSVSNPSQALTTGILGAVLAVSNVISAQLYENDTSAAVGTINGVPNPGNYPAKSITLVVNGGSNVDIATAIAVRKTPGCYTDGDQVTSIYDRFGIPTTIRFYRPITKTIDVAISVHQLTGYSSDIGTAIKTAIVTYINTLVAGQNVILSQLEKAALSVITNDRQPTFSITSLTAAIHPASPAGSDITMNFNWQAISTILSIALTAT